MYVTWSFLQFVSVVLASIAHVKAATPWGRLADLLSTAVPFPIDTDQF